MSRAIRGSIPWLVLFLGVPACSREAAPAPSSLLLVTIDTLRADRVGAYGSRAGLTPTLDALAASGWLFERTVSAVPLTLPAHATLLSGLDPLHHGVRNNGTYTFPETRETLGTRLKAQGYATGAFVAAVVLDRRYGLARGFDVYDDRIARASEGRSVLESERSCDAVTASAIAWLQSGSGPFFAWVHFYEPHAPYVAADNVAKVHPGGAYDAEVATADRCLEKLLVAARAARPDRLLTAVTSDHGEGLGDHGESTHGLFVYQSTLEVPMVVAGPGIPAGKRSSALARSADLAPTLLAILKAPALEDVDGRDLTSAKVTGESYAETDYPKGFGWAPLRSWRLGDLKLIDAPEVELYDLGNDAKEERNLAAQRPQDVDRLRAVLRAAQRTEVKSAGRRASGEAEERLRSLGYVAGTSSAERPEVLPLDPKLGAGLFRDFEKAMESEARGDLSGSVTILRSLLKRDSANLTFHRSLASALRRGGRQEEGANVLMEALKLAPRDASIAHDLGILMAARGRGIQAIEYEELAIALDPAFVDALDHLATLEAFRANFERARALVDRALALDGNHARAWSNRGNISRAQGVPEEAEKSYERALELDPNLVDAENGLGVLAVERGALDHAAKRFERVLEMAPRMDEARLNLAVVEAQRGHLDRAISLAAETARVARDSGLRARAREFLADLKKTSR